MRIGFVLDDTLDTPDGVQQYVLTVGAWLRAQGHDIHYLVGNTIRTDIPNLHSLSRNIAVKFNGNRMSVPFPSSGRRLNQVLHTHSFDVLHIQVPYSPFLAGRLIRLANDATAVVGTFHILPYSQVVRFANHGLAILNGMSGPRFDGMMAVSEPAKQFAAATYHYKNLQVVPNPFQLHQFAGIKATTRGLHIVFLGRLVERKGAYLLLKAVALLHERSQHGEDFHVHIGGKGALLPELELFVATNGLSTIVSFDGFIAEDKKALYLAQADLAVFPSTSGESFGIVLLEAMAVARGVVLAGNNPGYASVLSAMPNQLFDPNDAESLSAMLVWWLHNESERSAASKDQKAFVKQFDINVVGPRIEAVYQAALQSRRTS